MTLSGVVPLRRSEVHWAPAMSVKALSEPGVDDAEVGAGEVAVARVGLVHHSALRAGAGQMVRECAIAGRRPDGRRHVGSAVMIRTMAYRPFPKTRFLVEPPPAVLVAPDVFQLAVRELEVTPERRVSNRGKAAFNLHQTRKVTRYCAASIGARLIGSGSRAASSGTDETRQGGPHRVSGSEGQPGVRGG
jgi:hypothetical protein